MMVKEAKSAAMTNRTPPSTSPLASIAGALPRNSSAIVILPSERPVPATFEHHHAAARFPAAAPEHARDPGLEPPAERGQRQVEKRDERNKEEQLAGPDHPALIARAPRADQRPSGLRRRLRAVQVRA